MLIVITTPHTISVGNFATKPVLKYSWRIGIKNIVDIKIPAKENNEKNSNGL